MNRIDVSECHKYLLQLAKAFHDICVRHSIPYYMVGGTQLGAIRHRGFIPWDDDMDFGVPRRYYEELMNILDKELPAEYKIQSIYHSPKYTNGFYKIEDSRTLIKETNSKSLQYGVNIDIFPIDYTNGKKGLFSKNWWIVQLYKLETYSFADLEGLGMIKIIANKILRKLMFFINNKTIFNFIDRHLLESDGRYWVNHYGAYTNKEIIEKEIYGQPTLYDFEDTKLFGIEKVEVYLKHFYGNYMELPKESARHFHIEELYVKQEY